jgi:predicted ribosome quality control (RQC) complex YloA/Tae2 family protein
MSFDGLMLHKVTNDLNNALKRGRIQKIYQLSTFELLFTVKTKEKHQLMLNASRQDARISLTHDTYEKPMEPPMFCMFLRKHLEGGIIECFTQYKNDRVIDISILTVDERKAKTKKHLVFEMLGKDTNMIVTNEDYTILDSLNHVSPFETSRTIAPGAVYKFPEDTRINPRDEAALKEVLEKNNFESRKDFLNAIQGISPLFAQEVLHRQEVEHTALLSTFKTLMDAYSPVIKTSNKTVYAFYDITHKEGVTHRFDTLSQMLDQVSKIKGRSLKKHQHERHLSKFIKRELDKKNTKLEALQKDLRKTKSIDEDRIKGELILSYQHQVTEGNEQLICLNYYTNESIIINLDPHKTPIENSNAYFKRYKKRKRSIPHLKKAIRKVKREKAYFLELESQLEYAELTDLYEIRSELIEYGYMKPSSKHEQKKPSKKAKHLKFIDDEGVEILVGKNNLQNANLTHNVAKHNDVWFHTKDAPGSHVIAKTTIDAIGETTLRTAANLAALYSKMRYSSSVPVDYTEVRYVKKIPKRPANEVRYTNQKTIYIDPDEQLPKTLNSKK